MASVLPLPDTLEVPAPVALTADDLEWHPQMTPQEHRAWLEQARGALAGLGGRPLRLPEAPREAAALNRARLEALRGLEGQATAVGEALAQARRLLERVDLTLVQAARLAAATLTAAGRPTSAPGLDLHERLPVWARPWAATWGALREARLGLGVSERQLAERSGLSRGYLHDLETGRRKGVTREGAFSLLARKSLEVAAETLAAVAIERGAYPAPGEGQP